MSLPVVSQQHSSERSEKSLVPLSSVRRRRESAQSWLAAGVAIVATLAAAAPAAAEYEITEFGVDTSTTQAGAHPDVSISFKVTQEPDPFFVRKATEDLRTLEVELPAGLIGNAASLPACSRTAFADIQCPVETQVGVIDVHTTPAFGPGGVARGLPIYNLVAGDRRPAALGAVVANTPVPLEISVRSGGDYGLTTRSSNLPTGFTIIGMDIRLWGVPADPANDDERGICGGSPDPADRCPAGTPRQSFMVNPTECVSATASIKLRSYQQPDRWLEAEDSIGPMTGCENLSFEPTVSFLADNRVAGKPSAAQVSIGIPHNDAPDALGAPALRRAIVTLPDGVTINPNVAFDRTACDDWAFGRNSAAAAVCPAGSKIGTFGLDVPALPSALPGDIYLGEPKAGNPYRLFLFAEGQGTRVKLEGSILPDPKTGRITAVFEDNPQVPFRRISLQFIGGGRGVLLMPENCGIGSISAWLTPYSSAGAVGASGGFQVLDGCTADWTRPFQPTFEAGVTEAKAGADTGFVVRFGNRDADQALSRLKLHLPTGLVGRLAAFPLCPSVQATTGVCSEDSLVGGVTVSAGSTEGPLNLAGRVFLTEAPKAGQIAGLAFVVPAVVGPYNLGTVVVRAGITVNPDTSLTIESDPLPEMLQGIQLRIKQVIVQVDRPGFMFNPTDCSPKRIAGSITSVSGTEVGVESPFAVRGCADMPLEGRVAITTAAPARDGGNTGLTFNLGGLPGHSNVRQVQVVLPSGVGARLEGPLQSPCSESDFAADACSEESRVGVARAETPVLPEALAGNVYFIENPGGNALPRLGIRLKGAVNLDVIGDVEVTRSGRVATTFPAIPDVPISDFVLDLDEGENAVLAAAGLCGRTNYANVDVVGHSGKRVLERVPVTVAGCPARTSSKGKAGKSAKRKAAKREARKGRGL